MLRYFEIFVTKLSQTYWNDEPILISPLRFIHPKLILLYTLDSGYAQITLLPVGVGLSVFKFILLCSLFRHKSMDTLIQNISLFLREDPTWLFPLTAVHTIYANCFYSQSCRRVRISACIPKYGGIKLKLTFAASPTTQYNLKPQKYMCEDPLHESFQF